MGRVFKREMYVLSHSLVFWVFIIAMMLFALFTTYGGVANRALGIEVFYFKTGTPILDSTFDELAKDVYEIRYAVEDIESVPQEKYINRKEHSWIGQIFYLEDEHRYRFAPYIYQMLTENEVISEKYGYLLERSYFVHGFERDRDSTLYSPETAAERYTEWTATAMLNDAGGTLIAGLLVGAFVFGRSYSHRIFTADALNGVKRRQMFFGRMCAYLIIAVLFTAIDVLLCFAVIVPESTVGIDYSSAFWIGFAARMLFDLFMYAVGMLFAVLIPKWFLAPIAGFAFVVLTRTTRIYWLLGDVLDNVWSGEGFVQPFTMLALCTLVTYALTSAVCVFRLHRARLK